MATEQVIVWISKYSLTIGIYQVTGQFGHNDPDYFHTSDKWSQTFSKKDWHLTEEEAIAKAILMATAKVASLKKQLAKILKIKADLEDRTKETWY